MVDIPDIFSSYMLLRALFQTLRFGSTRFMGQNDVIASKSDVRIGIIVDDLLEKVSSHVIFGALVQKLVFRDGVNGHFGFGPLAENASIFLEGPMELNHFRMVHRIQINR